jgi:hypothetical protein
MKVLRARHAELVSLRDQNAEKSTRFYGANADRAVEKTPVYDASRLLARARTAISPARNMTEHFFGIHRDTA